ncbi:hypothetical protein ABID26_004942 [Mesorhizobium shonense]|uniref:Uncharacterized protein n=2 Tax=Mesorhizobium TaxID=68287 RepID=A0ABV2HY06_9HYPH
MNGKETGYGTRVVKQCVDFNGLNLRFAVVAAAFSPFATA